jgi:glutathione S-transferase
MADAPQLALYFAPGSSSMAPHIVLHELGAAFEPRPVSFHRHETRTPEFLALNPAGKVPVLLIDGRPLTEVAAILYWLARRFPEGGLWPEGGLEADAQALAWMSFLASTVHPARRQGVEAARTAFATAERRLGPGDWVFGGYSVVDVFLFRLYWRFRTSLGAETAAERPKLEALYARMMARPAVQRTIAVESAIGYELPA